MWNRQIKRFKLKNIKSFMFYLCLWDITTDICYLTSRPAINDFLWKLSVFTLALNLLGPALILMFGHIFNTFIHVVAFKSQVFDLKAFMKEFVHLLDLSHAFVFKTLLDRDVPKQKAFYRTAFLIHITFESFPQLVLQCVTNQKLGLWMEPLGMISILTSSLMIFFTLLITIKTDKYYL